MFYCEKNPWQLRKKLITVSIGVYSLEDKCEDDLTICQHKSRNQTTRIEFQPTRAVHIGFAVQRLNHLATSSTDAIIQNFTQRKCAYLRLHHAI